MKKDLSYIKEEIASINTKLGFLVREDGKPGVLLEKGDCKGNTARIKLHQWLISGTFILIITLIGYLINKGG